MKKTLFFVLAGILAIVSVNLNAQDAKSTRDLQSPPAFFNYQVALRDASGLVMAEEEVEIVVDILEGGAEGAVVYTQTQVLTTTAQGLVNLHIGNASELNDIEWDSNSFFLRLSVDGTEMGTSELLTVPYALYAKEAGISNEAYMAETADFANEAQNAEYADTAVFARNVQWNYNDATSCLTTVENKVAIGTSTPSAQFHVGRNDDMTNSQIWISQDGAGDACIGLNLGLYGTSWSMGIDNSDDDKLKLSNSFGPSNDNVITLTTDQNVGIGTSDPTARLEVVGGTKVGANGIVMSDIIELTGTTNLSASSKSIPFPSGLSKTNTRVLAVEILADDITNGYKSLGYQIDGVAGSICVSLSDAVWLYYPNDDSMKGQTYRITLMKVQ